MPSLASGFACFGPGTFVSAAFILSQIATKGCNYIKPDISFDIKIVNPALTPASFGLWCIENMNGSNIDIDNLTTNCFDAARACAVTTTSIGATVWCLYVLSTFILICKFGPAIFMVMGLALLVTSAAEASTFILFKTNACALGCSLDTGGKCGVAACVLWFVSALMSFAVAKERKAAYAPGKAPKDEENQE